MTIVSEPYRVRVRVRGYELDTQGHLNWAEYLHYAEHARWELLSAAGITQNALLATGIGPVALDANITYRHELRGGDEVDVSCEFRWGVTARPTTSSRTSPAPTGCSPRT